jgi:hypothetical protein
MPPVHIAISYTDKIREKLDEGDKSFSKPGGERFNAPLYIDAICTKGEVIATQQS